MKKVIFLIFLILSLLTFSVAYIYAYDEKTVHKAINVNAAKQSNNLLRSLVELGLDNGLESSVNGQKIYKWIEAGGKAEDEPFSRGNNHFHDPTKAWDKAGLDTIVLGLKISGDSSIIWAQKADQGYTDNGGNYVYFGGTWSWPKAREYYYLGLTATTKELREQNLAYTFKTVGHIMHLVSDVSVPAHVRNDAHPWGEPYEAYTKTASLQYSGYATVNFPKLTDFWDDEQGKGLAEFTNSNFFSKKTNFDDNPQYLNPTILLGSQEIQEEITNADGDKETVTVRYGLSTIIDNYTGSYDQNVPITAYSVLDFDSKRKTGKEVYSLNDKIHQTYADFLIPRAVGYSAGLLNYFFRGDIDMIPDGESGSGYVIVNNNTDEDMNGTFELWYDNKNDERLKVSGASWTLSINKKDPNNSNANKSANITFTPPSDMKEENKYLLVFQGKLGNEEGAVIGKQVMLRPLLIFLHNGQHTLFMTFDKNLKLTPYPPFILTFGDASLPGIETTPATIQSNETFTEHYYMPSTIKNKKISSNKFKNYGRFSEGKYLLGNRNSFTPTGWDKNSPLQYSTDLSYLSYPSNYISSGRHNWDYSGDSLIKNLEVWKETDEKHHIRYTTESDVIKGNALPFSEIYALLSEGKTIGISNDTINESSYREGTRVALRQETTVPFDYDIYTGQPLVFGGFSTYRYGNGFYVGDVLLDTVQSSSWYEGNVTGVFPCVWGDNNGIPWGRDFPMISFNKESWNASSYAVNDYDSVNGDEIFIVIYTKTSTNTRSSGIWSWPDLWDNSYDFFNVESTEYDGNIKSFYIAYRTKDTNFQKKEICKTEFTTVIQQKLTSDVCTSDFLSFEYNNTSKQFQGQAMFNPSTKIFNFNGKTYIAYSYSIYDYIGDPQVANFDSELLSDWRFNKRIVGFIDVNTGQKSETEINDNFLGSTYNFFDKTLYGAIGFHNGSTR